MKLYFFAQPDGTPARRDLIKHIAKRFTSTGIEIISNLDITDPGQPVVDSQGQPVSLENINGLVIEGSVPSADIGYLLAYAIAEKKPTLFLIEKRRQYQSPLLYLSAKQTPAHIMVGPYTATSLEDELNRFSAFLNAGAIPEIPSIKFTLRITPQIERYLRWKSGKGGASKADHLRDLLVQKIIPEDEEYQRYLRSTNGRTD